MLWGRKAKKEVCVRKALDYSTLLRKFQQNQSPGTKNHFCPTVLGLCYYPCSLLHLVAGGGRRGGRCGKCREHNGEFRGQQVGPLVNYAMIWGELLCVPTGINSVTHMNEVSTPTSECGLYKIAVVKMMTMMVIMMTSLSHFTEVLGIWLTWNPLMCCHHALRLQNPYWWTNLICPCSPALNWPSLPNTFVNT